jgi:hypothetical protein
MLGLALPRRERLSRFSWATADTTSGSSCIGSPANTTLEHSFNQWQQSLHTRFPIGTQLEGNRAWATADTTSGSSCKGSPAKTTLEHSFNQWKQSLHKRYPIGTQLRWRQSLGHSRHHIWFQLHRISS